MLSSASQKERRPDMGTLYQRAGSKFWWAQYLDNDGRRQRVSTGTSDEKQARDFLKIREGRAAEGTPIIARVDRVSFAEVRDNLLRQYEVSGSWKHMNNARRRISHLSKFFGRDRVV